MATATQTGGDSNWISSMLLLTLLAFSMLWIRQCGRSGQTPPDSGTPTTIEEEFDGGEVVREAFENEYFDYDTYTQFKSPCGDDLDALSAIWCKHAKGAMRRVKADVPQSEFFAESKQEIYDLAQRVGQKLAEGKGIGLTQRPGAMHLFVKFSRPIGRVGRTGKTTQWVKVMYHRYPKGAKIQKIRLVNMHPVHPPRSII